MQSTDSLNAQHIEWRASSFAKGVWVKDLGISDGYAMQLVRFEAGASFPPHHHEKAEFIYMLEGELRQNQRLLSKGCFSISHPTSVDEVVISVQGCLFLLLAAQ